jgi:hypothetical protein
MPSEGAAGWSGTTDDRRTIEAVNRSNLPFHPRFWQSAADSRPLALLRLGLGLLVVVDLADRLRDLHAFYTSPGLTPPSANFPQGLAHWSLLALPGGTGVTLGVYLIGFPLAVAVGPRPSAVAGRPSCDLHGCDLRHSRHRSAVPAAGVLALAVPPLPDRRAGRGLRPAAGNLPDHAGRPVLAGDELFYLVFWPGADGREPADALTTRDRRLIVVLCPERC